MTCDELAERLTDLMEGSMPKPEEAAALEHLATCTSCEKVLAETQEVVQLAKNHGRATLSTGDRSRMLSSLLRAVDDSVEA